MMMTLNGKIEVQQMFPMNHDYRPWTIFEKNSLPKICIDKKNQLLLIEPAC